MRCSAAKPARDQERVGLGRDAVDHQRVEPRGPRCIIHMLGDPHGRRGLALATSVRARCVRVRWQAAIIASMAVGSASRSARRSTTGAGVSNGSGTSMRESTKIRLSRTCRDRYPSTYAVRSTSK